MAHGQSRHRLVVLVALWAGLVRPADLHLVAKRFLAGGFAPSFLRLGKSLKEVDGQSTAEWAGDADLPDVPSPVGRPRFENRVIEPKRAAYIEARSHSHIHEARLGIDEVGMTASTLPD